MRFSALICVSLLALGCSQDGQSNSTPSTTTPPPKPAATSNTAKPTPAGNPNRIFQLDQLKTANLKLGGHPVRAWIMDSEAKRQEGMMFLQDGDVAADQGMLFVFPSVQGKENAFWMHNTYIPLDIIYIGKDKKVVNVGNGKKLNDDQVLANGPYFYVLEMKAGTAKNWGVGKGASVEIPDDIKTSG